MEKNLKLFLVKSGLLVAVLLAVTFLFRFPIDFFNLKLLSMNEATRIFSKSDAIKILALAMLFFGLYYKEKIAKIKHEKQKAKTTAGLMILGVLTVAVYYALRYIANVYNVESGIAFYLIITASMLSLILAFAFFILGVFSFNYLKSFYKELKKPLWITAGLAVIAYLILMWFQNLWPLFAYSITRILYGLFYPLFPTYIEINQTPILDVNGFVVSIGAPCSGIESLFLFAAFSIGIYALDHKRIKTKLFIISSLIGLVGIYFVNILRLFLLILTGIYISPDFAVGMFHTNVGWILFVLYFLIYYCIIRKFIYEKSIPKRK
jgi:exosortase/archaeosortase family protein